MSFPLPSVHLLRFLRSAELLHGPLRSACFRSLSFPRRRSTCTPVSTTAAQPKRFVQDRHISVSSKSHAIKTPTTDRGPPSKEDTQTDFGSLDVLGSTPAPTTSIDACLDDGFHLNSGLRIRGGSGCLLIAGEAFSWRPWEAFGCEGGGGKRQMLNKKGQWEAPREAWGLLDLVWPRPGM